VLPLSDHSRFGMTLPSKKKKLIRVWDCILFCTSIKVIMIVKMQQSPNIILSEGLEGWCL
jgi:hypothetical protein